jgi:spore coat protein U domain-containing protein, fimbrial subunit CupE1/2/3/6
MKPRQQERQTVMNRKGDHMKRVTTLATALIVLLASAPAFAASSATSNFSVTATVSNNCTISTTAISFGAYDPTVSNLSAPLDATGSVTITCTKGASTTIGLNAGAHGTNATGTTRAMSSGSGYLSYELYQDTGRATVWDNSTGLFTPPVAPSKDPRTFTMYGRIPAGQDVPASTTYTDTVTATVNF